MRTRRKRGLLRPVASVVLLLSASNVLADDKPLGVVKGSEKDWLQSIVQEAYEATHALREPAPRGEFETDEEFRTRWAAHLSERESVRLYERKWLVLGAPFKLDGYDANKEQYSGLEVSATFFGRGNYQGEVSAAEQSGLATEAQAVGQHDIREKDWSWRLTTPPVAVDTEKAKYLRLVKEQTGKGRALLLAFVLEVSGDAYAETGDPTRGLGQYTLVVRDACLFEPLGKDRKIAILYDWSGSPNDRSAIRGERASNIEKYFEKRLKRPKPVEPADAAPE